MANMDSPSSSVGKSKSKLSPFSLDVSDSRSSKSKSTSRSSSLSARHSVKASDLQQQLTKLQEELNNEKEEKLRAMEELSNMKKIISSQKMTGGVKMKVEALEKELNRVKESERKMFESLMSQTQVLEQTKISLEEVKLENKALRESNRNLESSSKSLDGSDKISDSSKRHGSRSSRKSEKHSSGNDLFLAEDEIRKLQDELRSSTEAEEKSKIAMDGLASALKEVTMENGQMKETLTITKSKLEKLKAEEERLRSSLQSMEEKYEAASQEAERFKFELEESIAAWNEKENSLISCIKLSEEEVTKAKEEKEKLYDYQKGSREENANLRDILKHAVNEASVFKESLEIARKENSQLKDLLAEKEKQLQLFKQEFDSLKVSEAAATDSVKELKSLLAATSTFNTSETVYSREIDEPSMASDSNTVENSSSESWKGPKSRIRIGRRHSIGEAGKFKGTEYDGVPGVTGGGSPDRKGRVTASISNMSEITAASSFLVDDGDILFSDAFDHMDTNASGQAMLHLKRKKTFVQRFGDILTLKRKGSYKQNSLPPVGLQ